LGKQFIAGQGELVLHPTDVILSPPQLQALDVMRNKGKIYRQAMAGSK